MWRVHKLNFDFYGLGKEKNRERSIFVFVRENCVVKSHKVWMKNSDRRQTEPGDPINETARKTVSNH